MSDRSDRETWRARLTAHIRATGGRVTGPRLRVAEVFFGLKGHPGVEEVARAVHGRWPGIGHATVYRTLHLLAQAGLVESRQFGEGFARYEAAASREHHDHIVCTACGAILEFEDPAIEEMQKRVAENHGFHMLGHRLDIYGVCPACRKSGAQGHRRPVRRPRRPRRGP
jgi:Fur family transcriptional regulator, ferric uptake regulator